MCIRDSYGGQYTLLVDGTSYDTYAEALAAVKELRPGTHTVTAQGAGAYEASSSEVTITIAVSYTHLGREQQH